MFGVVNYAAFLAATVALCLTPGVDTIYILTRSIAGGRAEGVASALGINTGLVVHTVLVATGLSLVLAASPVAFTAIKVAGAVYLVVMGVRSVLSDSSSLDVAAGQAAGEGASAGLMSMRKTYAQGVATNVLNPKIILFFLALLPQFVATPNGFGAVPFLILGLTYTVVSTLWTLVLVMLASPLSRLLRRSRRAGRVTGVVSGVVYMLLGGAVFLTSRP